METVEVGDESDRAREDMVQVRHEQLCSNRHG